MNPINQINLTNALNEACNTFVFSGYQLAYSFVGNEHSYFGGHTSHWESKTNVLEDTFFDLGSLTKVILTTSVIARLVDRQQIDINSSIEEHVVEFKNTAYASITLKQLLTHSSGLIAWHPFYLEKETEVIPLFLKNAKKFFAVGGSKTTTYSDLGFLLLGEVLKKQFGNLNDLFHQEVVTPLKLNDIKFGPLPSNQCVATEYCVEREKLLQGEVFDHNTDHLGGICSHAGLFSSAKNLLQWGKGWLDSVQGKSDWISKEVALQFIKAGQGERSGTWALGWDTKSKVFSSAGDKLSAESFGHLGFPGTSVWIDPKKSAVIILLTNRVHPSRWDERIKRFRPQIHNLVVEQWENYGS